MKRIYVVAAVIIKEGAILCTQRNVNKHDYISCKYEFPGGKVELGESEEAALIREIKEELALEIEPFQKYLLVEHAYPDFSIAMQSYLCRPLSEDVQLKEHLDCRWLKVEDLPTLDWAAADLPIVEQLMKEQASWRY